MNVGVGQLCTSPGLVFIIDGPGADDFVTAAGESVASTAAAPMLYPGIAAAFATGAQKFGDADGVQTATRGPETPGLACPGRAALFVTSADQFLADPELNDEVFRPASVIVRVPQTQSGPLKEGA
jgi:alpha-ketoglutaric semialdehyde dehydrogenase